MSGPGPIPENGSATSDELAHTERMRALREAAEAKLAKLNDLYGQARRALALEAEQALEPLVQGLYDAMTPILETFTSRSGELLADYRQGVAEAREDQEHAARELRMLHQQRMARLHENDTRCGNCNSWLINGDKCLRCNGQPPPEVKKPAPRKRVQA